MGLTNCINRASLTDLALCRSRKDTVWQKVAADAHSHIDEICKRRGLICEVQQKTAANAVHSDENLLGKLVDAIKGSQKVLLILRLCCHP